MALADQLLALYRVHKHMMGMEQRLNAAQKRHRALTFKLETLHQQRQELADQLRHAQAKAANLETEARAMEDRISRLREQMNQSKTNKEYSALLVEVNTLKVEKGKIEDQALEQLARVDTLQGEMEQVQTQIADQNKLLAGAQAEVQQHLAEVGQELAALKAKRETAAQELPPDVRAVFERLSEAHEGEVMAEVIEDDRRRMEYSCGGCYMRIPAELVNNLIRRASGYNTCPSCGRILYMGEELRASMTPNH